VTLRLISLVLDANDTRRLARFWAGVLHWESYETHEEIGLTPMDGTRFNIVLEPVPEPKEGNDETAIRAPDGTGQLITFGPPVSPKTGKNRLHLDLAPPKDGD
jgi:Glyoxalase-like domain